MGRCVTRNVGMISLCAQSPQNDWMKISPVDQSVCVLRDDRQKLRGKWAPKHGLKEGECESSEKRDNLSILRRMIQLYHPSVLYP